MGLAASSGTANSENAYLADLFAGRTVLHLQIDIPADGIRDLSGPGSGSHRPSVLATVREGAHIYTNVALHLKGGAGSYRPLDDDPSLTLNFEKYAQGQSFHGLKKVTLNNSVQDPSFLNEKIARELFNSAGTPAPRAGFTTVQLNERRLGVHVLTEGFNKEFLRHYFTNVHGNLYQTRGNQEITDRLAVNSGDDPKNNAGLRDLARAVKEPDPSVRWHRLEETLDVNRFITFMAMEIMLCHWDGYCMNQNNYRVFHDLGANKIVFIPHGMDQMFGTGTMSRSADSPIFPRLQGAVAEAVMTTSEGRRLYLARLGQLYTNLLRIDVLSQRVDELAALVENAVTESGAQSAQSYQRRVNVLKAHIEQRSKSLARQLADVSKPRAPRVSEPIHLTGWTTRVQKGQLEFAKTAEESHPNLLHISASQGNAAGSWRTRVQLEPGRYRFEGEMRLRVESANEGAGAGLRVSSGRPVRELVESVDWRPFAYDFQVEENREVELICELRRLAGEAWFDADKLQVVPAD
jgi:hypothetical protein